MTIAEGTKEQELTMLKLEHQKEKAFLKLRLFQKWLRFRTVHAACIAVKMMKLFKTFWNKKIILRIGFWKIWKKSFQVSRKRGRLYIWNRLSQRRMDFMLQFWNGNKVILIKLWMFSRHYASKSLENILSYL